MRPLAGSGRIARIGPSVMPTKLIEGATFPTGADDVIRIAGTHTGLCNVSDRSLATKMRMLIKKIRPSHRQSDRYGYSGRTTTK
jgi:hypothetical protein